MGYYDVWANLGINDFVSRTALQDAITNGVFTGKGVSLVTGDFVQRSQCATYAYLNTPAGTTSSFATKSEMVSSISLSNGTNIAYASSSTCIYVNSKVLVGPNKWKTAKSLRSGDRVYTKHSINGKYEYCTIAGVMMDKKDAIAITTPNRSIIVSLTQPIYSKRKEWTDSLELVPGDEIFTDTGFETILHIKYVGEKDVLIYQVDDAHTFFANGVFCHNKGITPVGWSSAAIACSSYVGASTIQTYYNGAFGNGTVLYATASGGTFGTTYFWSTTTYYYNAGYSFTVTSNGDGTYTVGNYAVCSGSVTSVSSGVYPVMGASGTSGSTTITNNSGATIYIYGGYYMAGAGSATINTTFYFSTVETINLTGATATYYYTTAYYTLANGSSTTTWSITKNDSIGTGAIARWYYATSVGGAKTAI